MPDAPSAQQEANRPPQRLPKQLKETLNLPRTDFPMKANLPTREPERLAAWESAGLYQQIRGLYAAGGPRNGAAKYVLHDGPPYANGAIHLGHALNKCIKDFVVKTKTMAGFDAPYVPGWDCHGLPIEIKVDEQLGGRKLELNPIQVRQACRDYAQKYIDLQRTQFKRLGVLGRWDIPYSTMNFAYEARIAETFFGFYEKGFVYKGLKPVYWCWHDRTALAEAEVEYEMHTSPSVYVRYKLTSRPEQIDPRLAGRNVYTIIWTTTPWTLPASMAVAFNPEFEYVALQNADGNLYIVAKELKEQVIAACNLKDTTEIATFPGSKLERVTFAHPFLNEGEKARQILGVLADYVTTEQGTGAVHTAPSHGPDDFATGQKYDLPLTCNVDAQGKLRNGLPEYDGLFVFKANAPIIRLLEERGALMGHHNLEHKYPHCWRCHNPLIFRATEQWFISMETPVLSPRQESAQTSFRARALAEIKRVTWDPSWGEERISNMVATRPDWCISRQRIWGVPIAVFLCDTCHEPLNDARINKSIVALFEKDGADAWYSRDVADLIPKNTTCPNCNGRSFRKETDILDVWFESGASWRAVLEVEPELTFPCDLYAEGGDQHRGWFQSSLLNAVGLRDISPFRRAITIGWTLGEDGSALSKSLGNGVDPVEVADRMGAEIIRLWVASVDFREDVVASENIMGRISETYRKLRNTLRFLLSNLSDFTPATDSIAFSAMQPLDQYILARTAELDASIRSAYEEFEFHRAYQALNEFINADLSALYLDVIKDRLYTLAPHAPARRSAQTALWRIAEALTRLIAPILSFTADEVWQFLPQLPNREPSVHLALFPDVADIVPGRVAGLEDDWAHLLRIRELVNIELEALRANKAIGKGLDAAITLIATEGSEENLVLRRYESSLPEFLNVSQVTVQPIAATKDSAAILIEAAVAEGNKCARCWRVVPDVGADARWPSVCARCAEALNDIHFPPSNNQESA